MGRKYKFVPKKKGRRRNTKNIWKETCVKCKKSAENDSKLKEKTKECVRMENINKEEW